jgi:hypothetical protein
VFDDLGLRRQHAALPTHMTERRRWQLGVGIEG